LISCSKIQNHDFDDSVVHVENSMVQINRTIVDQNNFTGDYSVVKAILSVNFDGKLRLNRVAIIRNEAWYLMSNSETLEATHITAVKNQFHGPGYSVAGSWVIVNSNFLKIQNSVFTDTIGVDDRSISGRFTADCNLIDNNTEWPAGSYIVGTPQFINVDGGDMRQVAASPGVDMCLRDDFSWSSEIDLENQAAPVNEFSNEQGNPGQTGGLYDAGVDEVYDTVGEDEFLLTVQKSGTGSGNVVSTPLGIACGSDCSEKYYNGTAVTLFAQAAAGSTFTGWTGCAAPSNNECQTGMTSNKTITAIFNSGPTQNLIFKNGFESP
jgi:hypothetical protein